MSQDKGSLMKKKNKGGVLKQSENKSDVCSTSHQHEMSGEAAPQYA